MRTAFALSILVALFFGCAGKELSEEELIWQPDEVAPFPPCQEELCIQQFGTLGTWLDLAQDGRFSMPTHRLVVTTGEKPVEITRMDLNLAMAAGVFTSEKFAVTSAVGIRQPPVYERGDWDTVSPLFEEETALRNATNDPHRATRYFEPAIPIPDHSERVYDLHVWLRDPRPQLSRITPVRVAIQAIATKDGLITCNGSAHNECWIVSAPIRVYPQGIAATLVP